MLSKAAQSILDAVYAVWTRMGIPKNLQVDNELVFYGKSNPATGDGAAYPPLLGLWGQPLVYPTGRTLAKRNSGAI